MDTCLGLIDEESSQIILVFSALNNWVLKTSTMVVLSIPDRERQ